MSTSTLDMTDIDLEGDFSAESSAEQSSESSSVELVETIETDLAGNESIELEQAGADHLDQAEDTDVTAPDGSPSTVAQTSTSIEDERQQAAQLVIDQISGLMPKIHRAHMDLAVAKKTATQAKSNLDGLQSQLEQLANDLTNIQSGEWQRPLPFKPEAHTGIGESTEATDVTENAQAHNQADNQDETALQVKQTPQRPSQPQEDYGGSHPISAIGMSEKETELLESADIATVADLEKVMRENAWWYRNIKGFGPTKVDKLMDKLMDFRKQFPIPVSEEQESETQE